MAAATQTATAEGTLYRCPKCKRGVTLHVGAVTVTCSRCGKTMRRERSAH